MLEGGKGDCIVRTGITPLHAVGEVSRRVVVDADGAYCVKVVAAPAGVC